MFFDDINDESHFYDLNISSLRVAISCSYRIFMNKNFFYYFILNNEKKKVYVANFFRKNHSTWDKLTLMILCICIQKVY